MTQYISLKNIKKKCEPTSSENKIKVEEIYVPKLICISSFIPYPMQFRVIYKNWLYNSKKEDKNTYRKGDRKFNIRNTISEKMCILPNKKKRLLRR